MDKSSYFQESWKPKFLNRLLEETGKFWKYFTNRRSLHAEEPDYSSPFFIIGSGRCGSTLLRVILNTHSKLVIPPESYVIGPAVREFQKWNYLPWDMLSTHIAYMFADHRQIKQLWEMDFSGAIEKIRALPDKDQTLSKIIHTIFEEYRDQYEPNAERWGDKSLRNTFHLDEADQVFPNAQYIHMLRDGRDVAASFINSGYYDDLELAAERWSSSIDHIEKFFQKKDQEDTLEIRYETLVKNTDKTVRNVCDFLGVNLEPDMLEFWKHVEHIPDIGERKWYKNVENPINDKSIGRHKKLSEEAIDKLNKKLEPALEQNGY